MNKCLDCNAPCKYCAKRCLACGLAKSKQNAIEKRMNKEKPPIAEETCKNCEGKFPRIRNAQAFCTQTCKEQFFFNKSTIAWINGRKRSRAQIKAKLGGFIDYD